jgi:Phage integrase, N-terminal SAM-like domain
MSALAPTLEAFFTERLIGQRHASPHTVAAYRDTWRLLLRFSRDRTGKEPSQLDLADLDAIVIGAFLDHLEQERHNSARTATPAWLPFARSSTTRRCATPSTPGSSPGCSLSPPNAASAPRSHT